MWNLQNVFIDWPSICLSLFTFHFIYILAAIVENKLLTTEDLAKYSKIPNIQAAQAELVHLICSIGNNLVTNLNSHQTNLVSHLDTRIKHLEDK